MFIFDPVLNLYVNDSPLLISDRVFRAAKSIDVQIRWDDDGYITRIPYDDCIRLAETLGIYVLSVSQYMSLAKRQPRVMSLEFAEWLVDTYELGDDGQTLALNSESIQISLARPGWFKLEDCDTDSGIPLRVSRVASPGNWKFWSLEERFTSAAIRSFVMSSGTCCLDLGIPKFAKHRKLMIRECYGSKLPDNTHAIHSLWTLYERVTQKGNDAEIRRYVCLTCTLVRLRLCLLATLPRTRPKLAQITVLNTEI